MKLLGLYSRHGAECRFVKLAKRKLDEAADQKRIADALEQIAKSKKEDKE